MRAQRGALRALGPSPALQPQPPRVWAGGGRGTAPGGTQSCHDSPRQLLRARRAPAAAGSGARRRGPGPLGAWARPGGGAPARGARGGRRGRALRGGRGARGRRGRGAGAQGQQREQQRGQREQQQRGRPAAEPHGARRPGQRRDRQLAPPPPPAGAGGRGPAGEEAAGATAEGGAPTPTVLCGVAALRAARLGAAGAGSAASEPLTYSPTGSGAIHPATHSPRLPVPPSPVLTGSRTRPLTLSLPRTLPSDSSYSRHFPCNLVLSGYPNAKVPLHTSTRQGYLFPVCPVQGLTLDGYLLDKINSDPCNLKNLQN